MLFHIYNIEQRSDTEVYIFGKPHVTNYVQMQTIRIIKIISPVYFLPSLNCKDKLLKDLDNFTSEIRQVEEVKRTNLFHKTAPRKLDLLRVHFNKKLSFENFDSEYCEMISTEFSNPVENLIISLGLRGPCLVDISIENSSKNPGPETTIEFSDIKFISNCPFPELKISSIICETSNNDILKYVYRDKTGVYKGEVSNQPNRTEYKQTNVVCKDSRELLLSLNNLLKNKSPDVVLFQNFHLKNKLNIRDKIICDMFSFASGTIKGRDFSIEEIASFYNIDLGTGMEWQTWALIKIFESMNTLALAKEMAEISGYLLNKSLSNSRSERIEYTLLHELFQRGFLFPVIKTAKYHENYTGGLVLDPKSGFYENMVLLVDFNSLYPSVIQEYNVCFSTIGYENTNEMPENFDSEDLILPKILSDLINRRKAVKDQIKLCKSDEEKVSLDIRQKALKLTANSIYGCLGSSISRFCNYPMASFITAKGRALLADAKEIAENLGLNVIYGDTDSLMILTKFPGSLEYYDSALKTAEELVDKINAKYKTIEIEVEKLFKKLLLYTKKKYAALVIKKDGSFIETKGLDLIRRDFCRASSELLKNLLNSILDDNEYVTVSKEDLVGISQENMNLNKNLASTIYTICTDFMITLRKRPVEDFVINSVLSKDPSQYSTAANLPHVALAQRLTSENGIVFKQDDVISYVIGEGDGSISSRAYHPDEKFKLDYSYYIKHQILPPVQRLLSLVPGIHNEKITLIFGGKEAVPKIQAKTLNFITPCCENVQQPAHNCTRCGSNIDNQFYILKAYKMLNQMCSKMYQQNQECLSCGKVYSNHLINCLSCSKPLKFYLMNDEFDKMLNALDASLKPLEIAELNDLLKLYSGSSAYRVFDFKKYFKQEIDAYIKNK